MPKESKDIDYNLLLDEIKDRISEDMNRISVFYKNITDSLLFKLNEVYELFNDVQKFEEIIDLLKNKKWEELDEKVAEQFIESLSFIFDITKISSPIFYAGLYTMQYIF